MHSLIRKSKQFRRILYRIFPRSERTALYGGLYQVRVTTSYKITQKKILWIKQWWEKVLKGYAVQLRICCLPNRPFTQKAKLARMGKGKGKIKYLIAPLLKNDILFELCKSTQKEKKKQQLVLKKELSLVQLRFFLHRFQYKWGKPLLLFSNTNKIENDFCRNKSNSCR